MGKMIVVDRDGEEHEIEAEEGRNLMEITRDEGMPVQGICGGNCICTTCHMYIDPEWYEKVGEPGDNEKALLESSGAEEETSRLGCQVKFEEDFDGLKVTLAPEF